MSSPGNKGLRNNKSKTLDGNDRVETLSRAAQEENSNINARENDIMETSEVADSAGENDEGREQDGIEDDTNSQTAAQMKDGSLDPVRDEEAQKLEGVLMLMRGGGGGEEGAMSKRESSHTEGEEEKCTDRIQTMKEADNNEIHNEWARLGEKNVNHNIAVNNSMKLKYPGLRHQDEAYGSGEKMK